MQNSTILKFLHFANPTAEQSLVLREMEQFVAPNDPFDFLILCGAAGTGKTSITAALIGFLNSINKSYKIAAPTGRAARILGRKAKTTTTTIHSLIYIAKPDAQTGTVQLTLKQVINVSPTIYIIDEASMVPAKATNSGQMFESYNSLLIDLVAYVKQANINNKIIFLGDRYQLPPIGEAESFALNKQYLEQTFNLKGKAFLLTEVKRQEDGSYILQNASTIRQAIDNGATNVPITGVSNSTIYSAADKYVQQVKQMGPENQIAISVSNKANSFFNDLVRKRLYGLSKKLLEPGDLLMVVKNWKRAETQLYNGDHVQLVKVDWGLQEKVADLHFVAVQIRCLFSDSNEVIDDYAIIESVVTPGGQLMTNQELKLSRERYVKNKVFQESGNPADDRYVGALRLTYGHAITCNKAQGGEWKKVFINTLGIPSLKWQYTAVTRAIDSIEKI